MKRKTEQIDSTKNKTNKENGRPSIILSLSLKDIFTAILNSSSPAAAAKELKITKQTLHVYLYKYDLDYWTLKKEYTHEKLQENENYNKIIAQIAFNIPNLYHYSLHRIHVAIIHKSLSKAANLDFGVYSTQLIKHLRINYEINYTQLKQLTEEDAEKKFPEVYDKIIENKSQTSNQSSNKLKVSHSLKKSTLTIKEIHQAILNTETLTAASHVLEIGHSTLSSYIKALESNFGYDYYALRDLSRQAAKKEFQDDYKKPIAEIAEKIEWSTQRQARKKVRENGEQKQLRATTRKKISLMQLHTAIYESDKKIDAMKTLKIKHYSTFKNYLEKLGYTYEALQELSPTEAKIKFGDNSDKLIADLIKEQENSAQIEKSQPSGLANLLVQNGIFSEEAKKDKTIASTMEFKLL